MKELPPEDLRERTKAFALRVITMVQAMPANAVARVLGNQVLRSGTPVGANYREVHRARSKAEFISKVGNGLKELEETTYWFELIQDSRTLPANKLAALHDECDQLTAIFTTIAKRSKGY